MTAVGLSVRGATFGYDGRAVSTDLSVEVPPGRFTAIVGPNASGKSTLLRLLGRLLEPSGGVVTLDGRDLREHAPKELARAVGLLPQSSIAPDSITVADLVARGRYPHQSFFSQWSTADEEAVARALGMTSLSELSARRVDSLSGGQRQRVWIALVLAQQTDILLLDEPTTFLDIAHQVDILDLCSQLNQEQGRTIVAVLHDLNQAARYADHLIVVSDGTIAAEGRPVDIVTADLVESVFGIACVVIPDPLTGTPLVVPRPRRTSRPADSQNK